jgi:plasmid stability protein
MGSMVVRNIPDDVLKALKELAQASGTSAEQIARDALSEKAHSARRTDLTREDVWAEIDAIRAQTEPVDWETYKRIWEEARAERDSRPDLDF